MLECCTLTLEKLLGKLSLLGLDTSFCTWILDFQTGRTKTDIGSRTLSTGVPQGCMLSPLLFTLIIKFADDTTWWASSAKIIKRHTESKYSNWCDNNNPSQGKNKGGGVVDFRRTPADPPPLFFSGSTRTGRGASDHRTRCLNIHSAFVYVCMFVLAPVAVGNHILFPETLCVEMTNQT